LIGFGPKALIPPRRINRPQPRDKRDMRSRRK